MAGLLALTLAAGCKAQIAPAADPALLRHIEVMVRSQFNIPQTYDLVIGTRGPSQIPGYDTLPIIVGHGGKMSTIEFMISKDNTKLARLETFDLAKDPAMHIDLAGRPIRGNPDAKVTVINYDDLECPYCARMHQSLFPDTIDRYKDKVRFIYKDDPLVEIHPWATHAAIDANCLSAQSTPVYWAYVDYLHSHGQEVNGEDRDVTKSLAALDRIARQEATIAKLDAPRLDICIAKQDDTQVKASSKEADALGVSGTPAIFVEGERIDGFVPEDRLWAVTALCGLQANNRLEPRRQLLHRNPNPPGNRAAGGPGKPPVRHK
jgi:protein-disulfide isomerase